MKKQTPELLTQTRLGNIIRALESKNTLEEKKLMKRFVKVVALVMAVAIIATILASCGKLLVGTYKSDSVLGSYVAYNFKGTKVVIDTYAGGKLLTSVEAKYKIGDGKITFTYTEKDSDGSTKTYDTTDSFEQNGDTIKIGIVTLTKSK